MRTSTTRRRPPSASPSNTPQAAPSTLRGRIPSPALLEDLPFADPASLLIQPYHYVTRLLHAGGVSLAALGVGQGPLSEDQARAAWRLLCANWRLLSGTQVRFRFDTELAEIFGVTQRPSAANADALCDEIAEALREQENRPQALLRCFGIEFLATTDDPADDLAAHAALAAEGSVAARIAPTFRPDRYLEPAAPGWVEAIRRLGEAADTEVGHYAGYLAALKARRRYFVAHGAVSADDGHADAIAAPLSAAEAGRIYTAASAGETADPAAV